MRLTRTPDVSGGFTRRSSASASTISVGPDADGRATAYFGDLAASVYAVAFATGEWRWKVTVDEHPDARVTGAPALHDGRLYVPVVSFEELMASVATPT